MKKVGIDAISYYVPKLYVAIEDLATKRAIAFEKLHKGLGLSKMAIPDVNEDAASFAANALLRLFQENDIDPRTVGRIYLGTESAVDGSKPTATYAVEEVEKIMAKEFGPRSFQNCDIVDMTFACIGGVDAMQNCLDWIRVGTQRKAIVIASDLSKYELNSTGEYTQGAGAVAVVLSENPSILSIDETVGVGTQSVGDFFKPRREYQKSEILKTTASPNVIDASHDFWSPNHTKVALHKEEPVFDGQYSNQCYSDRITEALQDFESQSPIHFETDWDHLIFHLPYAYHGRRIILKNWLSWIENSAVYDQLIAEVGTPESDPQHWKRAVAKSKVYKNFVKRKIEPSERASSQIGNMYTASIFMALLSALVYNHADNKELTGDTVGFIAYGSGSKAKVFQGTIQEDWKTKIAKSTLIAALDDRKKVDIETYENLHKGARTAPLDHNTSIVLDFVEQKIENQIGLRHYTLQE